MEDAGGPRPIYCFHENQITPENRFPHHKSPDNATRIQSPSWFAPYLLAKSGQLRIMCLRRPARQAERLGTRRNPKSKPRIASALRQVKALCASYASLGPAGDSAPTLRLKALVWPKGSFRPGKHGPNPPLSLLNSHPLQRRRGKKGTEQIGVKMYAKGSYSRSGRLQVLADKSNRLSDFLGQADLKTTPAVTEKNLSTKWRSRTWRGHSASPPGHPTQGYLCCPHADHREADTARLLGKGTQGGTTAEGMVCDRGESRVVLASGRKGCLRKCQHRRQRSGCIQYRREQVPACRPLRLCGSDRIRTFRGNARRIRCGRCIQRLGV